MNNNVSRIRRSTGATETIDGKITGRLYKLFKQYTPEGRYRDGAGRRFNVIKRYV